MDDTDSAKVMRRTELATAPAQKVSAPIVEQGVIHYECRVVHKNDVLPEFLAEEIRTTAYPQGNFHRVYFGKVMAAYASPNAAERLQQQ